MFDFIQADLTLLESNFDPWWFFLHGGPRNLQGGQLGRHGKSGTDSGALFFVKENEDGWRYSLSYALAGDSGVYRVRIGLTPEMVFDFSNPEHRQIAQKRLDPRMFQYWVESSREDYMDWATFDEDELIEWGFEGVILFERPKGFNGFHDDVLRVGVFDPKHIHIVDFTPKDEALKQYRIDT